MNAAPPARDARALSPGERKALALQRLDATRTRLIRHLYPAPSGHEATNSPAVARLLTAVMGRVQRDGWVRGAWRAVRALGRQWFKRQPWHAPAALVAGTLAQEVRPLLRHHPWACLATAAAVGAGLVLARPWVSRTVRQQMHGLPAQVGGLLWQQLAQAPVQLALAGALSAWLARQRPQAPATDAAAPPSRSPEPGPPPAA